MSTNNIINTPLITLGGAFTMTGGAFTFTGTLLGNTAVTFPTSGTLLSSASYPVPGATAGKIIISDGANWIASTPTFANSYTINNLLYANASNAVIGLATVNSAILTTSAGGVPTWSSLPLSVPFGGTGNSTFTAYSVILAGTTATGPFQNVSGVGTFGQALISNGAGLIPSWKSIGAGTDALTVVGVQVFTSNGTYTPTASCTFATIEALAGGGAGGSSQTTGAGECATAGGGGAGGYGKLTLPVTTIVGAGTTAQVNIGAAGAVAAAGINDGGNGGNTTVIANGGAGATLITANGGSGGLAGQLSSSILAGSPGGSGGAAGSGGDVNAPGPSGFNGLANPSVGLNWSGAGASSFYGSGAKSILAVGGITGLPGTGYGSGGCGSATANSAQTQGGAGTAGIVIITEYISS